jgi:hypothetical protein
MKSFISATVMALGLLVVPAAMAQTPTRDSVTGSGHGGSSSIDAYSFRIDAHSGPSGESPGGTASFTPLRFGTFEGPISCLVVSANTATLNFVVFDPFTAQVHVFTFTVVDLPTGDLFGSRVDVRAPTDCTPLTSTDPSAVADIVVVDAAPLPASKDECKNGGWRIFTFKNEGDCVSFVATGGKNPPPG